MKKTERMLEEWKREEEEAAGKSTLSRSGPEIEHQVDLMTFHLRNVITINGIDFPNTIDIVDGKEKVVSKPYRLGQMIYGSDGPFRLTKTWMDELTSRDAIACQAERKVFDSNKIKLHFETEGVRQMSKRA